MVSGRIAPVAYVSTALKVYEADDSVHIIFTGHDGEVYSTACSPTDATLVATGGGDDKGFLWRINKRDSADLTVHKDSISCLSFSADGQLLASGSLDGVVRVWDTSNGVRLMVLLRATGLRWYPKGHLILAGSGLEKSSGSEDSSGSKDSSRSYSEDSSVWMWNADREAYLNTFSGHASSVTCGDFTPDGKTICTGSDDATMRIWNPKTGENIHVISGHPYDHTKGLTCLAITSDSSLALTGSKDGSVHVVNIARGQVVTSLSAHSDSVECAVFEARTGSHLCYGWAGSRYIATGSVDGKVRIWDSLSGECVKVLNGHDDAIQSIASSCNGDYLVSASFDGTARVFQIAEFK